MPVQWQEDLPVREQRREPVGGVDRERGLADPGHPADHVNAPGRVRVSQLAKLSGPAGEGGDIAGQRPGRRCDAVGRDAAPGRGLERGPILPGQMQRVGQQPGRLPARGQVDAAFQVADGPGAQGGGQREFFLGQPGTGPQLPQQLSERHHAAPSLKDAPAALPRQGSQTAVNNSMSYRDRSRCVAASLWAIMWISFLAAPRGSA